MYNSYLDKLFFNTVIEIRKKFPLRLIENEKRKTMHVCKTGETRNVFVDGRICLSMSVRQIRGDIILYASLNMGYMVVVTWARCGDRWQLEPWSNGSTKAWLHPSPQPSSYAHMAHPLACVLPKYLACRTCRIMPCMWRLWLQKWYTRFDGWCVRCNN